MVGVALTILTGMATVAGAFLFAKAVQYGNAHKDKPAPEKNAELHQGGASRAPWWRAGGMHIVMVGSVVTIVFPAIIFAQPLYDLENRSPFYAWLAYGALCICLSLPSCERNFFAAVIMPVYQMTLVAGVMLPLSLYTAPLVVGLTILLFLFKGGVCMSVALHRYAAHAAFRCGPLTNFAISWLGCMANQGGPIWWGSQHRCHHKFCDGPRDPHSPELMGIVRAFVFFDSYPDVNEEFVPAHLNSLPIRVLDTFACVPVMVEQYAAYTLGGPVGLWISYTSSWLCQTVTLWFNIVNHPPRPEEDTDTVVCVANDVSDASKLTPPTPLFRFLNCFLWSTDLFGEEAHKHHHDYPRCALRPGVDFPYHLFVRPLEKAGLIWHLQMHS